MEELKCRYCGKKFDSINHCKSSPSKSHIAVSDGKNCIYCGKKYDSINRCSKSPLNKHMLDK